MIRPPFLKSNDKVVIISPAGNIISTYVSNTVNILREWSYDVRISDNALNKTGCYSGFVKERLVDLQNAMDNPDVKLIFCSRGGYGVVHLLDKLNFKGIKKNPKWIIGYSDITALHSALQSQGIMSIHGPMAQHFSEEGDLNSSVLYIKEALSGNPLCYAISTEYPNLNRQGKATGTLFGGNLSVYSSILGSKYIKIPKNGILFLEDIGEKPYRVDRMLYQLKLNGIFNKIRGLIIGQFTDYEEDNNMYSPLYESILLTVKEFSFPISFGFPVGHTKTNYPIIIGGKAILTVGKESTSLKQLY
ncbi:MAG: S66 peptidase family protein [Candidatus Saccharimonadaceae bacterium]